MCDLTYNPKKANVNAYSYNVEMFANRMVFGSIQG